MPKITIQGVGSVNFPDGMSAAEIKSAIENDILPKIGAASDPTHDMSGTQRFTAGAGKAFADMGRGAQQIIGAMGAGAPMLGLPIMPPTSGSDIDAAKKMDAPLMNTGAGLAGNIAGNVIGALPTALVPGVNTLAGAGAVGALAGAAQPVGTDDSRLGNAALSAAAFGAAPVAGALLKGARAVVEPMSQSGRQSIVGRTLNRFAGDDAATLAKLQNPEIFVPGSLPTTADASGNAGLAMLESGATTRDATVKQAFNQQLRANNAARVGALGDIAGDADKMAFYKANREQAAQDLYAKAFSETPDNSPWIKGQVTQLMQRPAFVQALKDGQELALNQGIKVSPGNPENTTQILHFTKQALDDQISKELAAGGNAAGLLDTQAKLISMMESKGFSPSYREARDTYKQMSAPINQMEIGQSLYNKMVPALNDFGGTARTRAQSFADALRNADQTAAKATGFPSAKMANVMSPEQMQTLTGIAKDLSRRASTEDMMRGVGSNTSANLATQNVMSQFFGPLGLPQSFGQRLLSGVEATPWISGLLEFGAKGAEKKIQDDLARALLDPKIAADWMAAAGQPGSGLLGGALSRYLPGIRAGLLTNSTQ